MVHMRGLERAPVEQAGPRPANPEEIAGHSNLDRRWRRQWRGAREAAREARPRRRGGRVTRLGATIRTAASTGRNIAEGPL